MNDNDLERLLEIAGSSVPVPPAPTRELVTAAGRRRAWRGWTLAAVSSVAAAVTVIGFAALNSPPIDTPSRQLPLAPVQGTRLVGIGHVFVEVPDNWGTNRTRCGTPQRDTVVIDAPVTETCYAPRPENVDSVSLDQGEPRNFQRRELIEIDGVTAEISDVKILETYPSNHVTYFRTVYFPTLNTSVSASSSGGARFVEDFIDDVRVDPSAVAVPGFMTVNLRAQDQSGDRYLQVLEDAGLRVEVIHVSDARWPDGFVTSVDPSVGSLTHPGDLITVSIASSRFEQGDPPRAHADEICGIDDVEQANLTTVGKIRRLTGGPSETALIPKAFSDLAAKTQAAWCWTMSSAGYRATAVTASGESIVVVSSTVNPPPATGVPVITCRPPEVSKIC
jgi:hypothetical protein